MKNKTKPLKLSKKIVIGNSAISKDNILEALPTTSKKITTNKKVLNVTCNIYKSAIVFSWAIKNYGFGELTYYIDDNGNLKIDDECLSLNTIQLIQSEIIKRFKKNKLSITLRPDSLENFFKFTNTLFKLK